METHWFYPIQRESNSIIRSSFRYIAPLFIHRITLPHCHSSHHLDHIHQQHHHLDADCELGRFLSLLDSFPSTGSLPPLKHLAPKQKGGDDDDSGGLGDDGDDHDDEDDEDESVTKLHLKGKMLRWRNSPRACVYILRYLASNSFAPIITNKSAPDKMLGNSQSQVIYPPPHLRCSFSFGGNLASEKVPSAARFHRFLSRIRPFSIQSPTAPHSNRRKVSGENPALFPRPKIGGCHRRFFEQAGIFCPKLPVPVDGRRTKKPNRQ